ncbi:unnamed protein product [Ranitomeya imitator]|uniref:Uncharacterized protein n=1 Tax=Ranitomeya imitator TaxID=111125 RepID=A0ABN9MNZ2_9NEOB|nr:unnamed protein product [Ranitomeya imitator]
MVTSVLEYLVNWFEERDFTPELGLWKNPYYQKPTHLLDGWHADVQKLELVWNTGNRRVCVKPVYLFNWQIF